MHCFWMTGARSLHITYFISAYKCDTSINMAWSGEPIRTKIDWNQQQHPFIYMFIKTTWWTLEISCSYFKCIYNTICCGNFENNFQNTKDSTEQIVKLLNKYLKLNFLQFSFIILHQTYWQTQKLYIYIEWTLYKTRMLSAEYFQSSAVQNKRFLN